MMKILRTRWLGSSRFDLIPFSRPEQCCSCRWKAAASSSKSHALPSDHKHDRGDDDKKYVNGDDYDQNYDEGDDDEVSKLYLGQERSMEEQVGSSRDDCYRNKLEIQFWFQIVILGPNHLNHF